LYYCNKNEMTYIVSSGTLSLALSIKNRQATDADLDAVFHGIGSWWFCDML